MLILKFFIIIINMNNKNTPKSGELFTHPFRASIVGSSGSGKSYMIS